MASESISPRVDIIGSSDATIALGNDDVSKASASAIEKDVSRQSEAVKDSVENIAYEHPSAEPDTSNASVQNPVFLMRLTRWHPFTQFFQFLSDCLYPKNMPAHERFSATRETFKKLFWICVIFDCLVMLAVLVGLSVIGMRLIYVTLF